MFCEHHTLSSSCSSLIAVSRLHSFEDKMTESKQLEMDSTSLEMQPLKAASPKASEHHHHHHSQLPKFFCSHVCSFANEQQSESDSAERSRSKTKLLGLIMFYTLVMIVEVVGGMRANSLAVLTDAAHLLTDIAGFFISLFAVGMAGWSSTPQHSFGFSRLEVLGALVSIQLIWFISGFLIYESVDRILHKTEMVNGGLMFAIAAFGFMVNLVMILWLGHDHHHHHHVHEGDHHHHHHHHVHEGDHHHHHHDIAGEHDAKHLVVSDTPEKMKFLNINVQGAYLHVMTDLIQSIGVMIAGFIIWLKPEWLVVDLISTLVFAIFALSTTLPMLKSICGILMERTPSEIDIAALEKGLKGIKGVNGVHDVHVWSITSGKFVLACHLVIRAGVDQNVVLCNAREYCEVTYGIHHVTIQVETDIV